MTIYKNIKELESVGQLSANSLVHADCLEAMKYIESKSIDMILCDLPYGTTACKWDTIIPFEPLWEQYKRIIKDNGVIVLFGTEPFTSQLINSNINAYKEKLTWIKHKPSNFACARFMHLKYTEDIVVFAYKSHTFNKQLQPRKSERVKQAQKGNSKSRYTVRNDGNNVSMNTLYPPKDWSDYDANFKNPMNYIEIPSVVNNSKEKVDHPTQKPVKLLEYLIKTYTNENETVLDNTMGVGTTCLAAKELNRKFIGIEKEPKYFEIACQRCGF